MRWCVRVYSVWPAAIGRVGAGAGAGGKKGPQKVLGRWLGRAPIRSMLASFFAPSPDRSGPRLRLRRLGPDNEAAVCPSRREKKV